MELWIRSQDKKHLMNAEAIMYEETGTGFGLRVFTKNYDFNIANYKTKERGLEVLDEIQSLIDFMINREMNRYDAEEYMQICYEELEKIKENGLIYQMPKD